MGKPNFIDAILASVIVAAKVCDSATDCLKAGSLEECASAVRFVAMVTVAFMTG
ncbi:hypothetical protein D3C84_561880 [compost metagenome]